MPAAPEAEATNLVQRRFDSVIGAARQSRTGIPLDRLAELLPPEGPEGPEQIREWLAAHPGVAEVVGDRLEVPGTVAAPDVDDRVSRGERFLDVADRLVRGKLSLAEGFVRCIAVTGSAAYGEPSAHDDLDFLVVVRPGAVWTYLVWAYAVARFGPPASPPDGPSHLCFNYVLDERTAREEFSAPQGFLFAREALTARPVQGESYYRGLVGEGQWLADEVPRLYARWRQDGLPSLPADRPAPALIRAANVVLFPLVAAYLHVAAMYRNHRFRRAGRSDRCFRVEARLGRLSFETDRFEGLRSLYAPASVGRPSGDV